MRKLKVVGVALGVFVVVGLAGWGIWTIRPVGRSGNAPADDTRAPERLIPSVAEVTPVDAEPRDSAEDSSEETLTDEEKATAAEEAAVEAFDALTDKWMEPAAKVDLKAIAAFSEQFRQVPEVRRDECIHRALNLIPDENVMLLAGVLMDKSMPKEIVETVFNDVLNRDEDVKKPILQEIFKDKTHPCWADTAWILDVTGELKSSADGI